MFPRAAIVALLGLALVAGPARANDLTLTDSRQVDARLQELTFTTSSLPAPTHVRILLPDGYDESQRYPVLWLLHGGAGNYKDWVDQGQARELTAGRKVIVVMPDGGGGGWYTDWYRPGATGQPKWETFHMRELLPWIDAHYPTRAKRNGRAIAGLSMGGFGTLSYAGRHPDKFIAASTFSGAVDTNTPPLLAGTLIDLISGLDGGAPGSLWGLRATDEIRWRGSNPWDLAPNLRGMTLALHTGRGPVDPLEVAVYPMNVSLHERLGKLGIDHGWDDYGNGTHTWPNWIRGLRNDLPSIMRTLRARVPAPKTIAYRSIATDYRVFGWRVQLDRAPLEFSELDDASRTGFRLEGSGTATVTTPRRYEAGKAYTVDIGGATYPLRAGPRGRLRITATVPSTVRITP